MQSELGLGLHSFHTKGIWPWNLEWSEMSEISTMRYPHELGHYLPERKKIWGKVVLWYGSLFYSCSLRLSIMHPLLSLFLVNVVYNIYCFKIHLRRPCLALKRMLLMHSLCVQVMLLTCLFAYGVEFSEMLIRLVELACMNYHDRCQSSSGSRADCSSRT